MIHFFSFLISLCTLSSAQLMGSTLKLDSQKPLRIEYHSTQWNRNPKTIDHAVVLFRDANSKKMARIEMQETDMNSSKFIGSYQLGFVVDGEIVPEIYVVPQKILDSPEAFKNVDKLIHDGSILRKPFFLRQLGSTMQIIEVYDTKEQAIRAYEAYKSNKTIVDRSALETQARAKLATETLKAADLAKSLLAERAKLESVEKLKLAEMIRQQAALSASEKAKRKEEARKLADSGMADYSAGKLKTAEEKFVRASELDPENTSYLLTYGETLYLNDKFNQSISTLKLASGPNFNETRRDYFLGMAYMRIKDNNGALASFLAVKNKNDKTMSATGAFYAGITQFQMEKYDDAKVNFEFTLDQSTDPKIDAQAENYIEQIANIKMYELQRSKKFIIGFSWGLMYDSNILNQAAASAATALNGVRAAYGGSVDYRPIYDEKNEFSASLRFSDMYSWDTSFQPKTEFQNTDPLTINLSFPYIYKGTMFAKPYRMTFSPGYERIYLNASEDKSGVGKREQIVDSTILKMDNTFVNSENEFAAYNIELRQDNSLISGADDDNQTATKLTLGTTQTTFKDKKKTEASIYDGTFAYNLAKGKNTKFYRVDMGLTYSMPWLKESTATGRLGAFYSKYPDSSTSRADNGLSLTAGLQKPIDEAWAAILSFNYSINNSNVDTNAYNKYSLSAGVSYNGAF